MTNPSDIDMRSISEEVDRRLRKGVGYLHREVKRQGHFPSSVIIDSYSSLGGETAERISPMITAEGLLALLRSYPFHYEGPTIIPLIADLVHILLDDKRDLRKEGIFDTFGKRGVVDSTVKVMMALNCVKRYMIYNNKGTISGQEAAHRVSISKIDNAIDNLCFWIINNQNEDGSWGSWKGEVGRVYPTYYAIKALLDSGVDSNAEAIIRAKKWFKDNQYEDGGWGFTTKPPDSVSGSDSDPADTVFGMLALTLLEPLWSRELRMALTYLKTNYLDREIPDRIVTRVLEISEGGVGRSSASVSRRELVYPVDARLVCALLQAGWDPYHPAILKLLKELINEQSNDGAWDISDDAKARTWYTYVVVDSFRVWQTYSTKTGMLPNYFQENQIVRHLYDHYKIYAKVEAALKKYKIALLIAFVVFVFLGGGLIWYRCDVKVAIKAIVSIILGGIFLGVVSDYLYDSIKNWWNNRRK